MRQSNQNLVTELINVSEGLSDTALDCESAPVLIRVVHAWLFS